MQRVRVGLALSGGGTKGIAHLGALKYFEEQGIEFDVVAGTSAGSIVGALHCAGMSAEEILDGFFNLSLTSLKVFGQGGVLNTERLEPIVQELFSKVDFSNQFSGFEKDLYVVATDMMKGEEVVFSKATDHVKVSKAILASASFPMVLAPMRFENTVFSDGGIMNHFPVDVISHKCDFLVGVYVSPHTIMTENQLRFPPSISLRALMLKGIASEKKKMRDCDIAICPEGLEQFSTFTINPSSIKKIFDLGYEAAKCKSSEVDELKLKLGLSHD